MKVPKRITEILNKKQEFIDANRDKLEKSVIKLQSQLLDNIIAEVVPSLDVKDGIIQDNVKNYRILGDLDKVYSDFTDTSSKLIGSQITGVTKGIAKLGTNYFAVVLPELGDRFEKIVSETTKKMNLRIGLEGGEMVRAGFLESFLKDNTLGTQIKNYVSKSVTGQVDTKEFIKGLSSIVNGNENGPGAMERQYQRLGFDLYQQYDAAYNSSLADEFGMTYFIYQNGLVKDSRDFCAAHNNKVWSKEEAKEWTTWTPSKGDYPVGYVIKQKDIYSVPSYLGYPGYQPLIDRGGYNCRHVLGYITDDLAFELRPELKSS